ncbi:uncharacterized protein LAJ45_07205 [Morchella importuna]|uniref:uncharacterized protein n=1 Tax=Morchella importuna TaxID=1174673 RepID=UPI001E8CEE9A|nr:uncharacterized protein LAJ45_07205 [Morchella importuna]KAH8148862.1 hypothetical protein LAJ45_07205 [Morchella importuna]
MLPDALVRRGHALVNVDPHDGRPRGRGPLAPDGVVEDDDLLEAGDMLLQDVLDLWVVLALDLGVIGELLFGGGDVKDGLEGLLVEVEVGLEAAEVVDGDGVWDVDVVFLGAGGAGFDE